MLELAGIVILGIAAQWIAWKIKVPAILPLIMIGLLVGPLSTLWSADGGKLIEPVFQNDSGKGLFPGQSLFYFVSLAIGIILFEGGLTLRRREITKVGPAILKLILLGSLITFVGAGLAAHFLMNLSWQISFLFGGLIIVTGPTVIAPILQNVPLSRNISTVLKWESILIDPLGALVAVIVFEFIRTSGGGATITTYVLSTFFQVIMVGLGLGALGAYLLYRLLKAELIPHYMINPFTLAFVLAVFVASDLIAHESGLLSVVVMGMVLGNLNLPNLKDILSFKESLSLLLISILFILLAANIQMTELLLILEDWRSFALFGFVVLVLRPAGVFLSTRRSELNFKEKLFISWMGPRGIVAAGISSLFGITLTNQGVPGAEYITPLVFLIVLGTVLLNAATARPIAYLLGVIQKASEGVLFVGANMAARLLGKYLHDNGRHVVLIDNNKGNIEKARALGVEAMEIDIYRDDLENQFELVDMGYLVAMTSSSEVNNFAISRYEKLFGEEAAFRLITSEELQQKKELPKERLLSYCDDFLNFNEVARDFPSIHELPLDHLEQLDQLMSKMSFLSRSIPVFVKLPDGDLQFIPRNVKELGIEGPFSMVYLGKALEDELVREILSTEKFNS